MPDKASANGPSFTAPVFEPEAGRLVKKLSAFDPRALGRLFKIGDALTRKTREQIREFHRAASGPAVFTFRGEAFKSVAPERFDHNQLEFAQSRMRILSGLYGVLRPLDRVRPYRLDLSTPLKIDDKTLKAFWRSRLIPYFEEFLSPDVPLVNLASAEYSSVLASGSLKSRMITVQFRETAEGGKLKNVAVRAKQARGAFAAAIIAQRISRLQDLKAACIDGYTYDRDLSSDREWFFVRQPPGTLGDSG